MPKTNDGGGATYAGYTGVVEHAGGAGSTRPGGLSELDPEKNLDGTLTDGDHPDHPDRDKSEDELHREGAFADPTGVAPIERADEAEHAPDAAKRDEEEGNDPDSDPDKGNDSESEKTVAAPVHVTAPKSSTKRSAR